MASGTPAQEVWIVGEAGQRQDPAPHRVFLARPRSAPAATNPVDREPAGRGVRLVASRPAAVRPPGGRRQPPAEPATDPQHPRASHARRRALALPHPRQPGARTPKALDAARAPLGRPHQHRLARPPGGVHAATEPGSSRCTVLLVENNPQDGSLLEFLALIQQAEAPILTLRTNRNRELPLHHRSVPAGGHRIVARSNPLSAWRRARSCSTSWRAPCCGSPPRRSSTRLAGYPPTSWSSGRPCRSRKAVRSPDLWHLPAASSARHAPALDPATALVLRAGGRTLLGGAPALELASDRGGDRSSRP